MLVSRDYMTRLDERVFRSQPQPDVITPPSRFYDIRPALITSGWSQNASGTWYAQGCFLTPDGVVDRSFFFPIWAPTALEAPWTRTDETRIFIVWRGRWETIGNELRRADEYVSGLGIFIEAYDSQAGGRAIVNTGLRSAHIHGQSGEVRNDDLCFAPNHFKWDDEPDSIGGKMLRLKTRRLNVVTQIVNGQPVRETIEVIGVD